MTDQSDQELEHLPEHSIDDLIQLALVQTDLEDEEIPYHTEALSILRWHRDPTAVFESARRLRTSENAKERALFADILGQLGSPELPFREETVVALLDMLQHETQTDILYSIGVALGHLDDPRAIEPLVGLRNHPHEDVRFGVVLGLLGHENPLAVNALIELSRDSDRDVKDWATFGLGEQIDLDTPEIRDALLARVTDEDPEVRGEALIGLAKRQDERVIEPLRLELSGEFYGIWAVEAAELLADLSLHPLIQSLWERLPPAARQKSWFVSQFQDALAACEPKS